MNCEHKFECGCGKTLCEECEEYLIENDGDHFGLDCQGEDCPEYYRHRNDNCDCHGFDCGYCNGEAEYELKIEKVTAMMTPELKDAFVKILHELKKSK